MPIARIGAKLVYFAHVPKCAGTSVEHYLTDRFGPLALLDWAYLDQPSESPWNRTSPQHIDLAALNRLVPPGFLDASFAIVRHPVDRIVSVFRYQRDAKGLIPADMAFGAWLDSIPQRPPHYLDNHTRPMCDLVPENARVFRLEDGTQPVLDWLDALAGEADTHQDLPRLNSFDDHLVIKNGKPRDKIVPDPHERKLITSIYAADFDRFGYDLGETA